MKTLSLVLLCAALLALGACSTSQNKNHDETTAVECTCGTREADLNGCACDLCTSGQGNPNNPNCICGPLKTEEMK